MLDQVPGLLVLAAARGSLYALIAVGLVLVFGAGRLLNLFHGGLFLLGAYGAFFLSRWLAPAHACGRLGLAFLAAAATGLVGYAYFLVVLRPRLGQPIRLLGIGLAANLLVSSAFRSAYGARAAYVPPVVEGALAVGPASVLWQEVVVLLTAAVVFPVVLVAIYGTRAGAALRAVSQDAQGARLVGISPVAVLGLTVSLAAALAGLAGALVAPLRVVLPDLWAFGLVKAFTIVILGGTGRPASCLAAAYGLGALEVGATFWLGEASAELLSIGVTVLALIVRPRGLLGST